MAVDQRNFGNVLDINGTEVNVEDKRLAELAGQTPKSSSQISTSSQYVPLQDTDGNIVKISPASFQEAVRNTLASLLVNNDKGTSFSQVPVIGSGDFGSASLANLASVLGAEFKIVQGSIPVSGSLNVNAAVAIALFSNSDAYGSVFIWGKGVYNAVKLFGEVTTGISISRDSQWAMNTTITNDGGGVVKYLILIRMS